jgi:hypothetical protein
LKNEVDLRSLGDEYLLALPRCEKIKNSYFVPGIRNNYLKIYMGY